MHVARAFTIACTGKPAIRAASAIGNGPCIRMVFAKFSIRSYGGRKRAGFFCVTPCMKSLVYAYAGVLFMENLLNKSPPTHGETTHTSTNNGRGPPQVVGPGAVYDHRQRRMEAPGVAPGSRLFAIAICRRSKLLRSRLCGSLHATLPAVSHDTADWAMVLLVTLASLAPPRMAILVDDRSTPVLCGGGTRTRNSSAWSSSSEEGIYQEGSSPHTTHPEVI